MSNGNVIKLSERDTRRAKKATRTIVDTILLTPETIERWLVPPIQRPLRDNNPKVLALVEELKENGGVLPGVLTLGVLSGKCYILDGRHRCRSFQLSGLAEGFADVRTCTFDTMAEMGEEFVRLNSSMVKLNPDDILRGLEPSSPALMRLRKACPFIGYGNVRRGDHANTLLSMSLAIKSWHSSSMDTPTNASRSAIDAAHSMTEDDAVQAAEFYSLLLKAWGRDVEYRRLWLSLNVTMCAWVYRRTVLSRHSARSVELTPNLFVKCLMSLSADQSYLDWLVGRLLNERDRSPCYTRIKSIFAARVLEETRKKAVFPAPAWWGQKGR